MAKYQLINWPLQNHSLSNSCLGQVTEVKKKKHLMLCEWAQNCFFVVHPCISAAGLVSTSRGQTLPLAKQPGAVSVFTMDLHASALYWLAKSLVHEFLTLSFNTVHWHSTSRSLSLLQRAWTPVWLLSRVCGGDCVTELLRPIAWLN